MKNPIVRSETNHLSATGWIQRRFKVSPGVATVVVELAFATRVARLGDRGDSLASASQEAGQ